MHPLSARRRLPLGSANSRVNEFLAHRAARLRAKARPPFLPRLNRSINHSFGVVRFGVGRTFVSVSFSFKAYYSLYFCSLLSPRTISLAQETINYSSVSGRVTDPSGAVVEGAQVTARQVETNLTSSAEHG